MLNLKYIAFVLLALIVLNSNISYAQTNSILLSSSNIVRYGSSYSSSSFVKERVSVNKSYLGITSEKIPGKQKKITGIVYTTLGCGLLAAGIVMVASADAYSYTYSTGTYGTSSSGDPVGAFGVLLIPGSLGFIIPGIVKLHKGSKMMRLAYKNGVYVKEDNSNKPFSRLWHLTGGAATPLSSDFANVYGTGSFLNSGLNFGLMKNKIKIGPTIEYDIFKKSNTSGIAENLSQFMFGASAGYMARLNSKGTIFLYPTTSLYHATFSDKLYSEAIMKGHGSALEMKTSIVLKSFVLGVSYLHYKPNSSFTNYITDKIEKNNDVYPIATVDNHYKLNLSTLRFSLGIIL